MASIYKELYLIIQHSIKYRIQFSNKSFMNGNVKLARRRD